MLVWVAILLLSHLMCFSPLKNIFSTSSIASRQIPLLSRFLGLTSTASQQIGRSIKPKSCALCLLNTSSTDSRSIEVFGLHLDRFFNLSRSFCMHFFFFVLHFFPFVPITSCFLFLVGLWFLVLLIPSISVFLSISDHVFWLFMPFDNHVKKGEKFENWMSFLRGSNRLRGRTLC